MLFMFSMELNAKQSMLNSVGVMSFDNQMSWSLRPKESVNNKIKLSCWCVLLIQLQIRDASKFLQFK